MAKSTGSFALGNPGRPPGKPNKATTLAREAIAKLVDDNAGLMVGWLKQIAADDPEKAWRCMCDVLEYHIPKLARTELHGPGENGAFIVHAPWLQQAIQNRNK